MLLPNAAERKDGRNALKEDTTPKKRGSIAPKIVFFIALAIFVISGIQLIRIYRNYRIADSNYEELREAFQAVPINETAEIAPEADVPENAWLLQMHEHYPAIIGWIRIPNTNIDYPVMYREGADGDSFYLTSDYRDEHSVNGSIFLEMINSPALDDTYSVIYGHNMNSGAMFHDLTSYSDSSFWEAHPVLRFGQRPGEFFPRTGPGMTRMSIRSVISSGQAPIKALYDI